MGGVLLVSTRRPRNHLKLDLLKACAREARSLDSLARQLGLAKNTVSSRLYEYAQEGLVERTRGTRATTKGFVSLPVSQLYRTTPAGARWALAIIKTEKETAV